MALTIPIEKVKGEVINIGTGRSISVLEIAKLVIQNFNKCADCLTYIPERHGQVQNHISSTEKAERILSFKARTPVEEGLKHTIDWYINNKKIWEKQIPLRKVPLRMRDGSIVWY